MSDALPLPFRPSLEQYKKLARELQTACKSGDPAAIRQWASSWTETLARLRGSENYSSVRGRKNDAPDIERRWQQLGKTTETVAKCTLAGTQLFIAREHGFRSWPKFAHHVRDMAHANSPASAFEAAADAIVSGDAAALRQLLTRHVQLVRAHSTREHRSTLLHYVSANGVEDFRQKTPQNIIEITNLLLDAGAEVDAESDAYGGGCTTLGLVATSVHPEKSGVQIDLLRTLLDRGANLNHPSAGGNNQSIVHSCLANGQPAAAKFLAELGAPLDLESAAALDRPDVLQNYFDESGVRRSGTSSKQMESGFLYACGYGALKAAKFLLDRGVDVTVHDKEGQTGLHWATWSPQPECIKLLLERGALVDGKDFRFQATPLEMALWTWDNASSEEDRERCYAAVALLARAGAKLDPEHWRDRGKGGSVILEKIDSDLRMLAALRGSLP